MRNTIDTKGFPISLLFEGKEDLFVVGERSEKKARSFQKLLKQYGVYVQVDSVSAGSCVTRYEFRPIKGTRISDIEAICDDIKLKYNGVEIRLEKQVPGKSVMALEIPNENRRWVTLRGLLERNEKNLESNMGFIVGLDTGNNIVNESWKNIGGL